MELSSLSENIVTDRFERNGELVTLQINIDAYVPDYQEELQKRLTSVIERLEALGEDHRKLQAQIDSAVELEKKASKSKRGAKASAIDVTEIAEKIAGIRRQIEPLEREIFAEKLTCPVSLPNGSTTCLLKGWNTTVDGQAIAPSKENLMCLPAKTLQAIWDRVEARLDTVKKTAENRVTENQMMPETTETGLQEFTIPLSGQVM